MSFFSIQADRLVLARGVEAVRDLECAAMQQSADAFMEIDCAGAAFSIIVSAIGDSDATTL